MKHAVFDPNAVATAGGGRGGQGEAVAGPKGIDKPILSIFDDISKIRNRQDKNILFLTDVDTTLRDFYWRYARGLEPYDSITKINPPAGSAAPDALSDADKAKYADVNLYEIAFSNKGGLVMPVIVDLLKTARKQRIPAQIWRKNEIR